ncbi:MAG: protein kinase [Planctomycetaceae bacterium]|nr:protein kinase [Planctomycetaceae bacterium]
MRAFKSRLSLEYPMTSPLRNESLNPLDQHRLDIAKDAFQSSLQGGRQPKIEDFLPFVPDALQSALLPQLLLVEFSFRRIAGDSFSPAEYAARFPEHAEMISKLFDQSASSRNAPSIGAPSSRPKVETGRVGQTQLGGRGPDRPQSAAETTGGDSKTVPEQFGRYRIERELGRGGMGVVYLAHDGQLDRRVALKIPFFRDDDDDAGAVERFYREARAMATVQHANLCPVFDVGQFERWHFLTMAFIDGQPLSKRLKEAGTLAAIQAVTLLRKVAMAVQKAHEAGIVHRDLKPSNIMLTSDHEPIIMDFGLARRRKAGEAELTQSGAVFGSPAYMAPEQVEARHHEIGPATDVYALGIILYQLVTGHRPFEGSAASIFGQIVSRPPAPPSSLRPDLPPDMDFICLKAIAKSPSQRHASAEAFADDLAQFLARSGDLSPTMSFRLDHDSGSAGGRAIPGHDSGSASVSRTRREAELRQVTVAIFNYETDDSSLSDTSSASHSEQIHEQAQSFTAFVSEHAARLGGVAVLGSGQEVITCFGFPQAFEDAAQRAVRVALQIMRDFAATNPKNANLPSPKQAWVTIHSGEAVAEELGETIGAGISLVGDARNMTVRLNTIVEPGTIVLSAAAHQRVALYFECESLGTQRVRGMSQPVELFKVIKEAASRNRVELVDPGNLTPLVGRDTELTILKDRWEQALDELGQIVLLIGDAGLGKSRLIRELREHVIREDSEGAAVIELRCSQYHQGTSFFPVVEFFSRLLDFENHSAAERLETVVRYLRELKLESAENVSLFCGMLSVPTDTRFPALALSPQKLKERTEDLLLQWLKQLVAVSPVLFIVEDLHWLDPSTLELLEKYVSEFESGRVLSLLTFRPEFETPWKSKPHQTQIALNRLTKRQIGEMMRQRTKRSEIPEVILQQIIERTDGIPLFIEEFTSVVAESGVLDRPASELGHDAALLNVIPATLHDLLLARLDRMASDRDVIQLAATIGREFGFSLLAASGTLPEADLKFELDKLVKAEILFQKGQGSAASFIFKHALLQDAAYRSMLTRKRQACHQRIAEVLESRFPDVVASQPELLAQHFTEAAVTDKAIQYWLKAGQKSQEQSANVEAIQQFQRGLAVTMTLPPSPQRDMLELGLKLPLSGVLMALQGYAAPEVESVQNRCIEICRQLGEGAPLFPLLIANWEWLFIRCRFADCDQRCPEVIALAEAAQGPGMIAEAHWTRVCTSFYAGDFPTAKTHAEIGWQHYHRDASIEYAKITQQNSGPLNLAHLGMSLWQMGFADQGFARLREGLALAYDLKHLFTQAVIEWKLGQTYDFSRIPDKAIEHGDRCFQIANEQGFAFWVALGIGCRGVGLKQLGRFEEAIDLLQDTISRLYATGSNIVFTKYKGHLADALWQVGRRDEAWKKLDEAFADQVSGERYMEAELLRWRGEFAFDQGRLDDAETAFRESLAVAARQRAKMYELRTTLSLCRLWKQRGQLAEVRQHLEPLVGSFTEGFDQPDLIAAKELALESGRSP